MNPTITILILFAIPAIAVQAKSSLELAKDLLKDQPKEKQISDTNLLLGVSIQNSLLILLSIFLGNYFIEQSGLHPILIENNFELSSIYFTLLAGILSGVFISLAYYTIAKFFFSTEDKIKLDTFRNKMPIWTRMLSGGVFEELVFRFGLQSFLFWIIFNQFSFNLEVSYWVAIFFAGLAFAAMHIPSLKLADIKVNFITVSTSLFLNLGVSIIFGYLFFEYGILSSILAHAILHVVWLSMDRYLLRG